MSDRILVPYDGSPPAKKALEYAFEKFTDSDVTALYVVPVPDGYREMFVETEERVPVDEESGQTILEDAAELAAESGHELQTELDTGKPDHVIVEHAADEGYDTIVMGSHGRAGVSRLLLGSVAENVVRRATVPVVVVR
ncbi:universal stress protein [Natronorubrum texcoconense]|uniref:Nucleotide-binding universal stress protein, UspA family n=1 Tax=Natronorubrum texcoconense TaxID=1095776 RepID=A0A1G8XJU0_9EURY|nr:universal stress protein [Natronorubrum texcoconense]SDJ90733.1 Nucleotide-binding universal stress protein, UspA family [Natronorubrum texcoconense]